MKKSIRLGILYLLVLLGACTGSDVPPTTSTNDTVSEPASSEVEVALNAFFDELCACDTICDGDGDPNEAKELACEYAYFESKGFTAATSCLLEELRTLTSCVDSASCDETALDECFPESSPCPEIPRDVAFEAIEACDSEA
jgi:hypothetical protein